MRRLKNALAAIVNSHPYFWYVAWRILPHLKFLLPHEKSYYAFRHFAQDKDGLFLDVGANDGLSALGFRHLVPNYRIFSVEANQLHAPSLEKLRKRLGRFDYIVAAAGDRESEFTLHTATYKGMVLHTGASLNLDYLKNALGRAFPVRVVKNISYQQQTVRVMKLDDLNLSPDIIKTDAEGFDYEVLLGLRQTIQRTRPYMLVEYSAPMAQRLQSWCVDLSYSPMVYEDLTDRFRQFDSQRENQKHFSDRSPVNLFLIPEEKVAGLPIAPD